MIDLEDALSALVDHAPPPPDVARVARRARQRQWRRRGAALTTALALLIAGVAGAVAVASSGHPARVSTVTPAVDHVRVTLLDGSQLEISGPPSLGLTKLDPVFNAQLDDPSANTLVAIGHSLTVERTMPTERGAVIASYPTHDGHELVVRSTAKGVDAAVQYDHWALVVSWNREPTNWGVFAGALNAKETADGFLVIEPNGAGWRLGPTDAPDLQLGGTGNGGATFSFIATAGHSPGCPVDSHPSARTPQGWDVFDGANGSRVWCDASAHVRVVAWDPALVDAAVQGLRVAYTPATRAQDRITTLGGASLEITAPSSVLDQLALQSAVYVDGLDTPNLLNTTPNLLPVSAQRGALPSTATDPSYPTGDGHRLFSYVPPTDCGCEMLARHLRELARGDRGPRDVDRATDADRVTVPRRRDC